MASCKVSQLVYYLDRAVPCLAADALFLLSLVLYGLGELAALRSAACQRFHPFFPVPLPVPPFPLLNRSLRYHFECPMYYHSIRVKLINYTCSYRQKPLFTICKSHRKEKFYFTLSYVKPF